MTDIILPSETVMLPNVQPERVEEEERERRAVEREAVPVEGEKETRVRLSNPEESVIREYGLELERMNEIELKVREGPSIVKREEEMPVQLTGFLTPVPDVVMVFPEEKDTAALSDE